ncbi:MAG: hypothetical protein II875_10905 [Clostridia bacterium]|nr:hypothetical protein [Clostridia bacterium]
MKRALCILLTLLLLCGTVSVASATSDYDEHKHHWVNMGDDRDATCTEPGEAYEYCDICHETRTRVIPPKGHHFPPEDWEVTKQPTCTEPGQEMNHCTRVNYGKVCGYEWRRELPALGHDWGEWYVVKAPKPGEDGIEERKCKRCGLIEQRPLTMEDVGGLEVLLNVTILNEQETYQAGEEISYAYAVTNLSSEKLYIKWVYFTDPDGYNGALTSFRFVPVEAGETVHCYDDKYTVKQSDIEYFGHTLTRRFNVDAFRSLEDAQLGENEVEDNGWVYVSAHAGEKDYELSLSAKLKNGEFAYFPGEEVYIDVTITNHSNRKLGVNDTWIKPPCGSKWYFEDVKGLNPGESQSFVANYTVAPEDVALSLYSVRLELQCNAWPLDDNWKDIGEDLVFSNVDVCYVDLSFGDEYDESDMELVVEKSIKGVTDDEAWPTYTDGEEVVFEIEVHNSQDYPLYDVVITDEDSSGNKQVLGTFDVFEGGQSVKYEYSHTVTESECYDGVYENTVKGEWYSKEEDRGGDKNLIDDTVTVDVWLEIGDMELYVEKTELSAPANGMYYVEGEKITYRLDAWNCQGYPLYDVTIIDRDRYGDETSPEMHFDEFGPHQSVQFEVTHTVKAEDCDLGFYENTCVGLWRSQATDGDEPNEIDDTVTVKTGNSENGVTVYKSVLYPPANGMYYVDGETIYYRVEVTNNGTEPLCDVEIYDELMGTVHIPEPLMPGMTLTVEYQYIVTKADVLVAYVMNIALVTWAQDGTTLVGTVNPGKAWSNEVKVPTGEGTPIIDGGSVNIEKKVVSTPLNGSYYVLGENVFFEIVVINDTDHELQDVEIADPLLGQNEDAVVDNLASIPPHTSLSYIIHYTVTQEDVEKGFVLNQASMDYYDTEENGFFFITTNTVVVETGFKPVPGAPHLTLMKVEESFPPNGLYYQEGETITYGFVLKNESNVPVYNVGIYDPLHTDGENVIPIHKVPVLGPMESVSCSFTYTVTKDDVDKGDYIFNEGLAEFWPDPDGEDFTVFSNTVIVPVGKPDPVYELPYIDMEVVKTVLNAPANGKWFVEGENVLFLITFSNTGDVPIYLINYEDEVTNSDGSVAFVEILHYQKVEPHTSASFYYTYTVSEVSALDGYFSNYVEFSAFIDEEGIGRKDFHPCDRVDVRTGPGELEQLRDPVAYKYETSIPKNGYAYTKGEKVEYDIVLYNPTGRVFTDIDGYDILLTDVPGYWMSKHPTLDTAPIVEHLIYEVDEFDVAMGDIYNIAWFTMKDDRGNVITVYSNEVIVETTDKDPPPPTGGGKACCEYSIVSEGEGAATYKNDYCLEHGKVEEDVHKLLDEASGSEGVHWAWGKAADLWQHSLDALYARLIDESEGETKEALENDRLTFAAYTEAYRARLEAEGRSEDEINQALVNLLRDRTCEMCYTFGHAPDKRNDLSGMAAHEQARRTDSECSVAFDTGSPILYTKQLNVCDRHLPLVKAAARAFEAAKSDETLLAPAYDRTTALWQNALDGAYRTLSAAADPLLKHQLLKEQAALIASVRMHAQLYVLLYPQDGFVAPELYTRMIMEAAMTLCK